MYLKGVMSLMALVVFIDLVGFGIVVPLLPFYGELYAPSHPFVITMLMATYSGCQLLASPLWGRLSDRVGRRPIVLISLVTSVSAYLWLSHASALWMLFATRALQGISAGNISVAQAYIADVTTPEKRAKGMGLLGAAIALGFTLGPAIGGWLAGPDPMHIVAAAPAYAAAGFSALALVVAFFTLKEPLSAELRAAAARQPGRIAQLQSALGRPPLRLLLILYFLSTFAFAGMETTFAQWALARLDWGPRQVGETFAVVGIVLILIQGGLIGRLAKRFGEARLLLAGAIMSGLGLAGLAEAATPDAAIIACSILALGQSLTSPAISSLVSRQAGASEQGGMLGINQSIGAFARLVGPMAAGFAFEVRGPGAPYIIGALVMLGAAVLALQVRSRPGVPHGVPQPP